MHRSPVTPVPLVSSGQVTPLSPVLKVIFHGTFAPAAVAVGVNFSVTFPLLAHTVLVASPVRVRAGLVLNFTCTSVAALLSSQPVAPADAVRLTLKSAAQALSAHVRLTWPVDHSNAAAGSKGGRGEGLCVICMWVTSLKADTLGKHEEGSNATQATIV